MILFDSEKSLEQFIIDEFNNEGICIIDGDEYDECISQFDTKTYGIPDLLFIRVGVDIDENENPFETLTVHIIELKNEPIKMSNIAQIARYKTYFDRAYSGFSVEVRSSLVVPKSVGIGDDICWVVNHINDIDVYEFTLNPSTGIRFRASHSWSRNEEDFEPALSLFGLEEDKRKSF